LRTGCGALTFESVPFCGGFTVATGPDADGTERDPAGAAFFWMADAAFLNIPANTLTVSTPEE
jgi:hypothetical protein